MLKWLTDTRRWLSLMLLVVSLSVGWIAVSAVPAAATTAGRIPSPREGFLAPDLSLDRLEGDAMDLESLRGQVVVVNFWATWCPPCRAEMPALERTYQAHQDEGLEILAVNATHQDNLSSIRPFIRERNLTFPILLDRDGSAGAAYQVRALPSTYFIDREGVIQHVIIGGPMSETTLRSTVQGLLQEAP